MSRKSRTTILRRLEKNSQSGSAALEFAFVAPVFFFLLLGIIQIGMMTFGQFALQNAVTNAARLLRTGQAQTLNFSNPVVKCANSPTGGTGSFASQQIWFNAQVCCGVTPYLDCSKLAIIVSNPTSFSSGFGTYDNSGGPNNPANYNVGPTGAGTTQSCLVLLVRATYPWSMPVPGFSKLIGGSWHLTDAAGGSIRTLVGTAAVRSEPFNSGVTGC